VKSNSLFVVRYKVFSHFFLSITQIYYLLNRLLSSYDILKIIDIILIFENLVFNDVVHESLIIEIESYEEIISLVLELYSC